MLIPPNMTEEEVLAVIDNVANRLANRFKFGYHETEDMRQQARIFAIEGMEKYDGKRPLENFLWTHVRNRLSNFKRDNYERFTTPCCKCREKCADPDSCPVLVKWKARNSARKNIMSPVSMTLVKDEREDGMRTNSDLPASMDDSALEEKIDRELPIELRHDYIRLKYKFKLAKHKRDTLFTCIKKILGEPDE